MARWRGGQARGGRLQGHRAQDALIRMLELRLASGPDGLPASSGTQGSFDDIEAESRRFGEARPQRARGELRHAVKRLPAKALRRQRHVEARRLLPGGPGDRRSGFKPDSSREGRF